VSSILLLLPPDRQVSGAIAAALDLAAKRRADLIAVVVIDDDASDRLSSHLIDIGLIADKVTDQVTETLGREYHIRAEALLQEVADQARTRGIACRTSIEEGDANDVCRRLIATADVSAVVLVAEKRSLLARILARDEPLHPPDLGGCEVIVVDED
jgi:nucleotide-binding universal stress UspA family protein